MKSIYVSPEIMYEDFSLSTNIAAGCEFVTNLPSEGSCGYQPPRQDYVVFGDGMQCTHTNDDTICYHNPTDSTNIYTS